ncbi:MAG: adenylate/guanylate cyclase domain-containing protein [Thermodesulfobacteriota bacterium]
MAGRLRQILSPSPFLLSLLLVTILAAIYIIGPRFLQQVELKALDFRFLVRGPIKPGPEVVIAAIDEKSVDEIGRWPWPRAKIAKMIDRLSEDGAKAVAFDIGFFEPDINTNLELIDRLEGQIRLLDLKNRELQQFLARERLRADNDFILAQSIKGSGSPIVLGYFFHMLRDATLAHIPDDEIQTRQASVANGRYAFVRRSSAGVEQRTPFAIQAFMPEANIPALHNVSQASGYFNMFPDTDGTVRWVPIAIKCRDDFFLPLSVQGLRQFLGGVPASITLNELGVDRVAVGNYNLPTDETGRLLVNYRGPEKTFPHYPITDILAGRLPQGTFKNKLVLVGATAVGIYDLRVTPFDSVFPGIEIHANVVDNVLRNDFLVRPGWSVILDLVSIIVLGLFLGLILPKLSALMGPLLAVGLGLAWTLANYYLFLKGIWVDVIYPLLTVILVYSGVTVFKYMTEEREKRKIKGAFSYYVNPSVVSEMLKNPDMLKLGGDKRVMTVLFSDIRGFTTISETMDDPEALVHLLNKYLTAMTNVVFKYDGLLDKYIGDAIMAVWGAPLAQPDHALRACRTCLEMMAVLAELRRQWRQQDPKIPFIDIGIGLNTGPMVVGNMGSETRFDYTVMGDAVNLGSRLEGANKQYGTNIIIGEVTFEQIKNEFYCRELDSVAVKGKQQPVRIFELLGEPGAVRPEEMKLARAFTRGLVAYKSRRWDEALQIFSAIRHHFPDDKPTLLYLDRVTDLMKNPPPPDWNGVYVMKEK